MKKWIIVAAFASAILAGCTKNEVRVDVPDQAISFTTAVGANSTKANADEIISGTVYPSDETFGTFAFYLPSGQGWGTNASDAKLYIDNAEVKYLYNATAAGNDWTTETPYYWPSAGSLTFFSYSPYDELNAVVTCDPATNGLTIPDWDVDGHQKVDIMVADAAYDLTGNVQNANSSSFNGVPTAFRHKLSQIVGFTFNTDMQYDPDPAQETAGDKQFVITGISIKQINTKGTYNSGLNLNATNLGGWAGQNTPKDYIWYAGETEVSYKNDGTSTPVPTDGTGAIENDYLLVLPQPIADNETTAIVLKYTVKTYNGTNYVDDEVTVNIPLHDIHGDAGFMMNKKITYNFTIGLNRIYWAPSVVEWDNASNDIVVNQGSVSIN